MAIFTLLVSVSIQAQNESIYCAPSGTFISHNGAQVGFFGSIINDAGGGIGYFFTGGTGTADAYIYNRNGYTQEVVDGPSAPTPTDNYNASGAYVSFYNLTTDNNSNTAVPSGTNINVASGNGDINVRQEVKVDALHTFANGVIWTPRNNWQHAFLFYETGTTYTGATPNNTTAPAGSRKFVDGYVLKRMPGDGSLFRLPLSDGIYSRFCGIVTTTNGTYKAAYFAKNAQAGTTGISGTSASTGPMNGGIVKVNSSEFWDIDGFDGAAKFMLTALNSVAGYSNWNTAGNFSGYSPAQVTTTAWDPWENLSINTAPANLNVDGEFITGISTEPDNGSTFGSGSPFSAYTWAVDVTRIPLPLNLLSFYGKAQGCAAELTWKTSDEQNTSHFEIERYSNSVGFQNVDNVSAVGNGLGRTYVKLLAQTNGSNYYRLKIIDRDGKFTYSPVINVTVSCQANDNSISVYPNPNSSHKELNVSFKTSYRGDAIIYLTNAIGQKIISEPVIIQQGTGVVSLNTAILAKGTYIITMMNANGELIGTAQKMVK